MELLTIADAMYVSFITSGGAGIQAIIFSFAVWGELNAVMPISPHSFLYSLFPHIVVCVKEGFLILTRSF